MIWGGIILLKIESLLMVLLYVSLASFSTLSYGVLNIILCCSITETSNNNFGTNCF